MSAEATTTLETATSVLARHAKGIDHVAIAVRNLEESIDFFSKVLGFECVERRRTEGKATAMISAVMKAGPLTFVLLEGTTPESQVSRFVENYGPGVQHLAIAVDNLEEVSADLRAAGLDFDTSIIRSPGLEQIFSHRDKGSGLMIELIDRNGRGDFSDSSVKQLFEELEKKDSF